MEYRNYFSGQQRLNINLHFPERQCIQAHDGYMRFHGDAGIKTGSGAEHDGYTKDEATGSFCFAAVFPVVGQIIDGTET